MRYLLLILSIVIALSAVAQKDTSSQLFYHKDYGLKLAKDTIIKKDTVLVPVYDVFDTSKKVLLQKGAFGVVRIRRGYLVVRGFAYQQYGKFVWNEQPRYHAFLNRRKKPIKNVIQIL